MVTLCPAAANFAKVPPQILSGSSGWPPTQTIFRLLNGRLPEPYNTEGMANKPKLPTELFRNWRREECFMLIGVLRFQKITFFDRQCKLSCKNGQITMILCQFPVSTFLLGFAIVPSL